MVSPPCNSSHARQAASWCIWSIYGQLGGIWPFGGKSGALKVKKIYMVVPVFCDHGNKGTLGRAVTAFSLLKYTQLINSTLRSNSVGLQTGTQILLLGITLQMLCDFCVLKWNWK